jgi:oligosaccharide repeat unit polymerase
LSGAFNSFIEYNIYGLRIFDLNLKDPSSIIHQHTFGRSLLGQIDAIFSILYRFTFDPTFLPANSVNGAFLNTYFDVGKNTVITANAFGTIFFTLYRDFGLYGTLFFSCLLGFILNWFNLRFIYYKKPFDFCVGLLLVYALIFSVYQSVFEGHFWPMLFIIISLEFFLENRFRIR